MSRESRRARKEAKEAEAKAKKINPWPDSIEYRSVMAVNSRDRLLALQNIRVLVLLILVLAAARFALDVLGPLWR